MKLIERNCPLCGSKDKRLLYAGKGGNQLNTDDFKCTSEKLGIYTNIYKCNNCGLLFQSPIPQDNDLKTMYKNITDNIYLEKEEERTLTFSMYLQLLKRYIRKKSPVLELGSYTGIFLKMLKDAGFEYIEGLELSSWARKYSQKRLNITIYAQELKNTYKKLLNKYEAVCLWDVFEHYAAPVEELTYINKILKKGGYLFLSTIDANSFIFKLLGKRYPFLMFMHLVYFSKKTMQIAFEKTGFKLIYFKKHKRYVSKNYLFNRFDILFKQFSFIFKAIFSIYFAFLKRNYIIIDFMGLVDVIAQKVK